ncbi:MAG TPA: hypothetical protein VF533_13010 [Solirubrobacteraceae bacterium]|jgi:hypothetical protein
MSEISHKNRRFVRHYIEMVVVMFAGMVVLGIPGEGLLRAIGTSTSELQDSAPAAALLAMATIMTGPMVVWMRRMGHGWRPCMEMAGSMYGPTFAVIGLMAAGALDFGGAMMWMHAAMLPAMLVVMLLRREEYSCHPQRHRVATA